MFGQFVINGLITGVLYSLLAIGFALVYNITRIFHIAAAGIYVVAAYLFYTFTLVDLHYALAAFLAILVTSIVSLGIDYSVYRPLKRRGAPFSVNLIASIGVMIVLVNLVAILWKNDVQTISIGGVKGVSLGEVYLTQVNLWQFIVGSTLLIAWVFIERSGLGLRLRAVSNNRELYDVLGHNGKEIRIAAFLLSGFFIGSASCLTVLEVGMTPQVGMNSLITALVALVLGGIGRFRACIYGGLLLGLMESVTTMWVEPSWASAVVFVVLLLILFLRPQGIAGLKQRTV